MVFSEEKIKEILGYLEEGMTQKDAAKLAGIDESTFYIWKKENPSFSSRVEASILNYKRALIKIIKVNAINDGKLALEILERRYPKEWLKKNIMKLEGELGIDVKKLVKEAKDEQRKESENNNQGNREL